MTDFRGRLSTGSSHLIRQVAPLLCLAVAAATACSHAGQRVVSASEAKVFAPLSHEIQGVWRPVEVTSDADARPGINHPLTTEIGPGLEFFTPRYYSHIALSTNAARPPVRDDSPLDVVMAAWGPFSANAGTYEIRGDTLFRYGTVAKTPGAMRPGNVTIVRLVIHGDTMWHTSIGGRLGSGQTIRYLRLERSSQH